MTYFKTIKSALDALIAGICQHQEISRDAALQLAATHLGNMSREWRTGKTPTIAYGDPICRFAYLFCHTAAYANICENVMRYSKSTMQHILTCLNEKDELKVCAFGGGPGTELLALTKILNRNSVRGKLTSQGEINFTLLDRTSEWAETWNALEAAIKNGFSEKYGKKRNWPFTTSKTFQPFDMTKIEQWANLGQLLCHDLYIMNYVVSEILDEQDGLQALLNKMAGLASSGARFIIVDRDQDDIMEKSSALLRNAGLRINSSHSYQSSTNMDSDEQTSDLGDYYQKISRHPRVKWDGAFGVFGVKP